MFYLIFNYPIISNHILMAVTKIRMDKIHCNTFVFIFFPALAPNGAAIKLATINTMAGAYKICPVTTLPIVEPIEDKKVIANEEAIVTRVGIFKITSMMGTSKNAPPAPTIPALTPIIKALEIGRARVGKERRQ